MREIDTDEYYEPIVEIDEPLRVSALERLREAVTEVRGEDDPIIYSTVMNAVIRNSRVVDMAHVLLVEGWNEKLAYQFVAEHSEELGITLYRGVVEPYLEIEPGGHALARFREQVGYFLVEHAPKTFEKIRLAKKASFDRLDQCERGIVGEILLVSQEEEEEFLVLKCTRSSVESEIAEHLGRLGLAPVVFESTVSILVEEYIPDPSIDRLLSYGPGFVGEAIGQILRAIHDQGVVYNNRIEGHVLVNLEDKRQRIIDLESADWGNDFESDWQEAESELRNLFPSRRQAGKALEAMKKWTEE